VLFKDYSENPLPSYEPAVQVLLSVSQIGDILRQQNLMSSEQCVNLLIGNDLEEAIDNGYTVRATVSSYFLY
jgi:hypothetical protein